MNDRYIQRTRKGIIYIHFRKYLMWNAGSFPFFGSHFFLLGLYRAILFMIKKLCNIDRYLCICATYSTAWCYHTLWKACQHNVLVDLQCLHGAVTFWEQCIFTTPQPTCSLLSKKIGWLSLSSREFTAGEVFICHARPFDSILFVICKCFGLKYRFLLWKPKEKN